MENGRAAYRSHPDREARLALFWRIVIVLAGVVLIWLALDWIAQASGPAPEDRLAHAVRAVLATVLAVPFVLLVRRYLDRRPWRTLGLASAATAWRQFLPGMVLWCGAAGLGLLLALASGIEIRFGEPPNRDLILLAIGLPFLVFFYEACPRN